MANIDAVYGARVIGSLGGNYVGAEHSYTVLAADGVALFVGDFVKLTGISGTGADGKSHPVVAQAAATETLVGIVNSFEVNSTYLNQIYRTASTLRTANVADDPYLLFTIQAKGTLAVEDIGLNADIVVGSGSTVTGLSGMEVDLSTKTAATAQIRLIAISPQENNDFGAEADVIGMINEHAYKGVVGA